MLTFTGAPLGGFVGGQIVSLLLREGFGWQFIFFLGGLFPLLLLTITTLWLPESPRFLASRLHLAPRQRGLLDRLGIEPSPGRPDMVDIASGNPIRLIFTDGFALQTTLLWIIFFCSLLDLFLFIFWLPEVLHLIGMSPAQVVFATSLYPLGGILAVLYLGWAISFRRAPRAGAAFCHRHCVHLDGRAGDHALPAVAGGRADVRHDGVGQPDRAECGLRQTLSGPHAGQRLWLRDWGRPPGRHRRRSAGWVSARAPVAANVRLSVCMSVRRHRRGRYSAACGVGKATRCDPGGRTGVTSAGGALWRFAAATLSCAQKLRGAPLALRALSPRDKLRIALDRWLPAHETEVSTWQVGGRVARNRTVFTKRLKLDNTSGAHTFVRRQDNTQAVDGIPHVILVSVQEVSASFESLRRRMKNVLEVIDSPMSQWSASDSWSAPCGRLRTVLDTTVAGYAIRVT